MFKKLKTISLIAVFLLTVYGFVALNFILKKPISEFPELRARFGTVMWHSEDSNGILDASIDPELHTYCYYPSSGVSYPLKGGEYILKRVKNYQSCNGWYGIVELKESYWVSEREKLWWDNNQDIDAALANSKDNSLIN